MPIWAYVYCSLILLAGIGTLLTYTGKPVYYVPGEILSVLISISFFLFYYDVLPKPPLFDITVLLVVYLIYWEAWENRHLYKFDPDSDEINNNYQYYERYDDYDQYEDIVNYDYNSDYEDYVDYENDDVLPTHSNKFTFILYAVTYITFLSPLLYVITMVLYSYATE